MERQFYYNNVMSGALYYGSYYPGAKEQVVICTGRAMRFGDDPDTDVLEVVASNGYHKYKRLSSGNWKRRMYTDLSKEEKEEALSAFEKTAHFLQHSTYAKKGELDFFHKAHVAFAKRMRKPVPPPLERKIAKKKIAKKIAKKVAKKRIKRKVKV